jgi:type IV pilus assembly protein PilY1
MSGTYVVGTSVNAQWTGTWPAAGPADMYPATYPASNCLATPAVLPPDGVPGVAGPISLPTHSGTPYTVSEICDSFTGWPCTHDTLTATGGSSNSLADVAQYYYKTDLRPTGTTGWNGLAVAENKVPSSATDTTEGDMAKWQHMTTFTMGLGVSGTFPYNKSYKNKPTGTFTAGLPNDTFQRIRCQDSGNAPLADPNECRSWPAPIPVDPDYPSPGHTVRDPNPGTRVDDLWHAAVNGRGQYFSAADPDAVFTGLTTALLAINAQSAAGTGATVSNQDPVPGNDLTFRAGFKTVDWTGDIRAQQLYTGTDLSLEGTTLPGVVWSAQDKLDGQVGAACDNRTIYLPRMGATNNMVPFSWNSYVCSGGAPSGVASTGLNAGEQAYFTSTSGTGYTAPFSMISWSQFIDMTDGTNSTVDQRALGQGANLVNFLRGQRGREDFASGDATKVFRKRIHVLGDIIGSQPRYVPPPNAEFTDTGYALFRSANSGRAAMLYAGANDGMLHAINVGSSVADTTGGTEAWAVIPTPLLPKLAQLADSGYSENHAYYVDGPPSSGDVYDKHQAGCAGATDATAARDCWKTVLIGGLGAGGRGYYALDVTTPASPKVMWEFKWSDTCYDPADATPQYSDCHIGLTFGAPLITKLVNGTWIALVSSGMNNVNSPEKTGDGQGYLYVLDAITGQILNKVTTGAGDATTPSGFSYINAYVDNYVQNNSAERVYGGDLLGNVWRIDLMRLADPADPTTAEVHYDVVKLATMLDPSGNPQPITTTPQMMNIGTAKTRMVYVGTGRYLGESDLSDTQTQTVYGLAEDLSIHSDSAAYIARGNTVLPTLGLTLRDQLNQVTLSTLPGDATQRQASTPVCAATAIDAANTCAGWFADLPATGERVTVDMRLVLGSLLVPTNVTNLGACDIGGNSWLNVFDAATGGEVAGSPYRAGKYMPGAITVGISLIRSQLGRILTIITKSDDTQEVSPVQTQQAAPLGRRSGWRDLLDR